MHSKEVELYWQSQIFTVQSTPPVANKVPWALNLMHVASFPE